MEKYQAAIDLESDYQFQKLEWRVQRVAWIVWLSTVTAALLGFLGPGLFSQTRSAAADGSMSIRYDRFVHAHHPTILSIEINLDGSEGGEIRLMVDEAFLASIDINRIDPAPKASSVTQDGVIYSFLTEPQLKTGRLNFDVDYEQAGRVNGAVRLLGHSPVTITQFVFP